MRKKITRRVLIGVLSLCLITLRGEFAVADSSGKQLWENYCSACHSLNPPPKLAPPVRGIVMNYKKNYPDKESFTKAVSSFVHAPKETASQMPHAVEKFNLMPPMPIQDEELVQISEWMWDTVMGVSATKEQP